MPLICPLELSVALPSVSASFPRMGNREASECRRARNSQPTAKTATAERVQGCPLTDTDGSPLYLSSHSNLSCFEYKKVNNFDLKNKSKRKNMTLATISKAKGYNGRNVRAES